MAQSILRLRGLPWNSSEQDIRDFLQVGQDVDVFIRRRGELSTGEAYVKLSSNEEASVAQSAFNREMLGGRYIEIFLAEAETMEDLKEKLREQDTGWVVRLRGLPFKATREDVLQFFKDIEVVRGVQGITLIHGRDGRPLGEAYVELPDEESQIKALHLDRARMGARYIEVFKSTKADLNVRLQSARRNEGTRRQSWGRGTSLLQDTQVAMPGAGVMLLPFGPLAPAVQANNPSSVLRLQNLPGEATVGDIVRYFSEFGVAPASVQISPEPGQPGSILSSSSAHVAFASPALADAARQQAQRHLFQDRYIEAFPAPLPSNVMNYQPQAVPMSPTGLWPYSPVGYMYEDLSKLLTNQSSGPRFQPISPGARPLGSPMAYLAAPGIMPAQNSFSGHGTPNLASLQSPISPGDMTGQRGAFSPRPLPGQPLMQPSSPFSLSQQQQRQVLLQQQQQQQLLMRQQPLFMQQAAPWTVQSGPFLQTRSYNGLSRASIPSQSHLQATRAFGSELVPDIAHLQALSSQGPEKTFAAASSGNLSERQSGGLSQKLSLASLHLNDHSVPAGRSPAASTSPSAPSPF